jgi:hypothetical protein
MKPSLESKLKQYKKKNTHFKLSDLKKIYPEEKSTIDRWVFIGLIEPLERGNKRSLYKSTI